ncbi:hypothetical protein [Aeromonas veronii]|uniref:hypothetical protein n=1 Tax=Aeromonas TaxID=642 RepID=UPI003B0066FF
MLEERRGGALTGQRGTGGLQRQPLNGEILMQTINGRGLLSLHQPALGHLASGSDGPHRQQQKPNWQKPAGQWSNRHRVSLL